jgi:AcrR family transcriptional regulator
MLQRAVAVEDKEERRQELLDAVEKLYLTHPDRMPNVAEVAEKAGLAKGTVYLYFPTKEDMLLELHQRHVGRFFSNLMKKLALPGPLAFEDIFAVTRDHMLRVPGYLALSSHCFAQMERETPFDSAVAFKSRVAQTLAMAGDALERHFPTLQEGDGIALLMHSYGLIVGLWQLLHPNERFEKALARPELKVLKRDYEREVEQALRALWGGMLNPEVRVGPPPKTKGSKR